MLCTAEEFFDSCSDQCLSEAKSQVLEARNVEIPSCPVAANIDSEIQILSNGSTNKAADDNIPHSGGDHFRAGSSRNDDSTDLLEDARPLRALQGYPVKNDNIDLVHVPEECNTGLKVMPALSCGSSMDWSTPSYGG